jgi:hypothetical protein
LPETNPPRYVFGPLERPAILLWLRPGQVAVLAIAALIGMMTLRLFDPLRGAIYGLTLTSVALTVALVRVWHGKTFEQLAVVVGTYGWRRVSERHRWRSTKHLQGQRLVIRNGERTLEIPQPQPESLRGLRIISATLHSDAQSVGILKDSRARTYIGVLPVRGKDFALIDSAEKARAVVQWSRVIASYALRTLSPVSRIQWIERTLVEESNAAGRQFAERCCTTAPASALESYRLLVEQAGPATQEHECFVVLQVSADRGWRQIRQVAGRDVDRGAAAVLLDELKALSRQLMAAQLQVGSPLAPRALAELIKSAYDPPSRRRRRDIEAAGGTPGADPANAWPAATTEHVGALHADRAWHATYHILEWPRSDVDATFLASLLLQTERLRTVAVTMEPVPPPRARAQQHRRKSGALTVSAAADRYGFVMSDQKEHEAETNARITAEMKQGHVVVRFSGYVTVTALDTAQLERSCAEIEIAASLCGLELERLYGQQEIAFTYTLPICRGLR